MPVLTFDWDVALASVRIQLVTLIRILTYYFPSTMLFQLRQPRTLGKYHVHLWFDGRWSFITVVRSTLPSQLIVGAVSLIFMNEILVRFILILSRVVVFVIVRPSLLTATNIWFSFPHPHHRSPSPAPSIQHVQIETGRTPRNTERTFNNSFIKRTCPDDDTMPYIFQNRAYKLFPLSNYTLYVPLPCHEYTYWTKQEGKLKRKSQARSVAWVFVWAHSRLTDLLSLLCYHLSFKLTAFEGDDFSNKVCPVELFLRVCL